MPTLTEILLTLTLVLCGGYAGMVLMCQIGVLPAMRDLSLSAYADAWRAMDTYMDRRMPPYKASLLLLNAATLVALVVQHRVPLAVATCTSLLLSVAGLVFTVRQQLPLNAQLKSLPANTPDTVLLSVRQQTIRGFRIRLVLAAVSFLVLCIGVIVRPLR